MLICTYISKIGFGTKQWSRDDLNKKLGLLFCLSNSSSGEDPSPTVCWRWQQSVDGHGHWNNTIGHKLEVWF